MPISIFGLEPDVEAVIFGVISCLLIGFVILVLCFIMTQILIWHRRRQLRHKRRSQGLNDANASDDPHQRQNRRRRGREFFFTKPPRDVLTPAVSNTGFSTEGVVDGEAENGSKKRGRVSDSGIFYFNKGALTANQPYYSPTTSPKKSSLRSKLNRRERYHNASPVQGRCDIKVSGFYDVTAKKA
uniref:Uncharacterized protein n=1 Tax=Romanomermis culicivorax TaxID=13658 RepID=A0A915HW72_ROMCU